MVHILSEKQREIVVNGGGFGYSPQQLAAILGVELPQIVDWMKDPESQFSKAYTEGLLKFDYVVDMKLFEMFQSGDLKAYDILQGRKTKRAVSKPERKVTSKNDWDMK